VLNGLDSFEGRGTLKAWIFSILVNRAKTRGQRDKRWVPPSHDAEDLDGSASRSAGDRDDAVEQRHIIARRGAARSATGGQDRRVSQNVLQRTAPSPRS